MKNFSRLAPMIGAVLSEPATVTLTSFLSSWPFSSTTTKVIGVAVFLFVGAVGLWKADCHSRPPSLLGAMSLLSRGDYSGAIRITKKLMCTSENTQDLHVILAIAYYYLNNPDAARKHKSRVNLSSQIGLINTYRGQLDLITEV